jgi:outer membrane protein OmpA-like peptidoglycan-associated protein
MSFTGMSAVLPFIRSGKLRALGVTTAKRNAALPDVPAIGEALPGYDATLWLGLLAPAGTPREVIARIAGEAIKVEYKGEITNPVSSKNFQIQFETGSALIKPESYATLDEILKSAMVAEGLKIGVNGHTDDVGDDSANLRLSEERALSVKNYLLGKGLRQRHGQRIKRSTQ